MNTVPGAAFEQNTVLNGVLARVMRQAVRLALLGVVLALAACNVNRVNREFDDDEVRDIGNSHTNEIEVSVDSMSLGDAVTVVDTDPIEVASGGTGLEPAALPSGCRTVINGSTTDSDADGIPDDVTFRFDAIKCARPFLITGTRTVNGELRIQDLNPSVADRSYRETLTNLTRTTQFAGSTTSELRNGMRSLANFGGTSLTKSHDITLNLNLPGVVLDLFVRNRMTLNFTATGGTIQIGQPLPAGTLNVQGSSEWRRGAITQPIRAFTINTPSALIYSPSCVAQKDQSFTGGELLLTRPSGLQISIAFKPCGTPPVFTQIP